MTRKENPLDGTSVAPESSSNNNNLSEMELHDTEEIRNRTNQILLMTAPSSFGENLQPGHGQSQQEKDDEAEKKRFLCNQVVEEQPLTKTQQMLMDERAMKQSSKPYDLSKATIVEKSNSSPEMQESEEIRLHSNQILILTSPGGANADQQSTTEHEFTTDDEKADKRKEKESLEKESLNASKDLRGSRKSTLHPDKNVRNPAHDGDSSTTGTTATNVTNSCTSFTPSPPVNLERDQNIRNLRSPGVIHVQGMHARRAVSTTAVEEPDIEEQLDEPTVADDGTHAISVVAVARDDLEKEVHELIISKAPVGEIFDVDDVRRKDRRRLVRVTGCIVCILVAIISGFIPKLLEDKELSQEEKEHLQVKEGLLPLLQNVSMQVFGEDDPDRLALSDTESPQFKAYEWMAANSDMAKELVLNGDDTNVTFALLLEQYALVSLYHSTTGENWDKEDHQFLTTDDSCAWLKNYSHCSDKQRVRVLDVAGINMIGTLPAELVFLDELEYFNASLNDIWGSLGPLWNVPLELLDVRRNKFSRWDIPSNWSDIHDQFRYIDVSRNVFDGTIPTEIFELSNIHDLRLTSNDFTGTFPSLIGELTDLVELHLGETSLTGSIPELISCSSLEEINLAGNTNMTGSIPEGLWSLPQLRVLDLSGLQLIMELPGDLMPKAQRLETLSLRGGRLQGSIPTEIGLMSNLQWLNLGYNPVLTGTLPSEIGTMGQLRRLDLQNILGITGTIPTEVGDMQSLEAFVFMGTALEGQIPTEIGRLTNLVEFIGRGSLLSSSIPTEVGHLTKLRQWDQLLTRRGIGTIPTEFGLLTYLERLVLPVYLEGTLPVQLSYLTELRELVVSAGRISGTIPATYGQLNKLHTLALSQHKLTGSIPLTFGALTLMRTFELMNNTLTGTIPQNIREWSGVRRIVLQHNNLTGHAGKPLCATWTQQYDMFGDCEEFEDGCPCCTQCCRNNDFRCYPHYNNTESEEDDGSASGGGSGGGGTGGGGGGGRPPRPQS